MELAAQIPGMVADLTDFDVGIVRRLAGDLQARRLQALFVFAIELVAVAMALVDFARAVGAVSDAALSQAASPASQPHGAAQLVDPLEFAQLEDDSVRRAGIELGGIGGFQAAHIARVFDHQGLHAEADPEVGHLVLSRVPDRSQHAIDAPLAEAAGHQDAVVILQLPLPVLARHAFGLDPVDVDLQLVGQSAVQQRFLEALIGVFVFHVLAHQGDGDFAAGVVQAFQHGRPLHHVARAAIQLEQAHHDFIHALGGEPHRHGIHALDVAGGDHGVHVHVAEEGDLLLHLLRDEALAAAQQNIGLDTEGAEFLHAVLRGLGLELLRRRDPRHQGHVDEQGVGAPLFVAHLADGFQERQRFDIAHRAADLGDHYVHVPRHLLQRGLDLIGHVRNHLHGFAQIIAAPLAGDDLLVDPAAGQVVALRQLGVREPLVVAQVEIRLGAVVGDQDFAVLERAHRARVHIQVRIELLAGDLQPAAFQEAADRRGRNPLAQRRDHPARYEYVFSHFPSPVRLRRRTTWTPVPGPAAYPHPATRTRFPPRGWRTRSPKRATAPGVRRLPAGPPAAPDTP